MQGFDILVLCWFDFKGMYVVKDGVFSDFVINNACIIKSIAWSNLFPPTWFQPG